MLRTAVSAFSVWCAVMFSATAAYANYPPQISPGNGPIVIDDDIGGYIDLYGAWADEILHSGRRVEIRGECASACTMILQVPRERMCVYKRAKFSFHRVHWPELWSRYPTYLRSWLRKQGGSGFYERWATLKGAELRSIFRLCGE